MRMEPGTIIAGNHMVLRNHGSMVRNTGSSADSPAAGAEAARRILASGVGLAWKSGIRWATCGAALSDQRSVTSLRLRLLTVRPPAVLTAAERGAGDRERARCAAWHGTARRNNTADVTNSAGECSEGECSAARSPCPASVTATRPRSLRHWSTGPPAAALPLPAPFPLRRCTSQREQWDQSPLCHCPLSTDNRSMVRAWRGAHDDDRKAGQQHRDCDSAKKWTLCKSLGRPHLCSDHTPH